MLLLKLLTNRAQMFADVRTCWTADSIFRVTGYEIEGKAKEAGGLIHLINSGRLLPGRLRREQGQRRKSGHQALLGDDRGRYGGVLKGHKVVRSRPGIFQGRRLFLQI